MAMARGGKSVKTPKHPGRPKGQGLTVVIEHIRSLVSSMISPLPQISATQTLSAIDHLKCPVCLDILSQTVELPCRSLVCASYIISWLTTSASCQCPCCFSDTPLEPSSITPAPTLIWQLLGDVLVVCPICEVDVQSRLFSEHQCTPQPKRANKEELQVTSSVIQQLLSESPENVVEIPTKGTVSHTHNNIQHAHAHTHTHIHTQYSTCNKLFCTLL